jgi:uncharacterized membrane protein
MATSPAEGRRRDHPRRKLVASGRCRGDPGSTERDPARVVAFSDAVIAIAVTLLVLEIRPPQDTRHLLRGLTALWPSYVSYVITFLLIGQVWATITSFSTTSVMSTGLCCSLTPCC